AAVRAAVTAAVQSSHGWAVAGYSQRTGWVARQPASTASVDGRVGAMCESAAVRATCHAWNSMPMSRFVSGTSSPRTKLWCARIAASTASGGRSKSVMVGLLASDSVDGDTRGDRVLKHLLKLLGQ